MIDSSHGRTSNGFPLHLTLGECNERPCASQSAENRHNLDEGIPLPNDLLASHFVLTWIRSGLIVGAIRGIRGRGIGLRGIMLVGWRAGCKPCRRR